MTTHVRTAIRAAFVAALTGLTTTQTRVFPGRVYPLESAELPGLLVYLEDEDIKSGSIGVRRQLDRDPALVIEAIFKTTASLDDLGDTILQEVEVALGTPGVALGGAKSVQPSKIEFEHDGGTEQPAARMRITFKVSYYTALGAPDVAL